MDNQEMEKDQPTPFEDEEAARRRELSQRLSTIGWALFFIWVGVSFLANFNIGIGLLGVGIITLAMQVVRMTSQLKIEWFWFTVGLLFLLGGIWELSEPDLPLISILLIVAGVVLLISVGRGKKK
jgi:hypothetical protein